MLPNPDKLVILGRAETAALAWSWLHACLVSTHGESAGDWHARQVHALTGMLLWEWAMENAAEA